MAASSILASRKWTDDNTSSANNDNAGTPEEPSYQKKSSEALLLFLEVVRAGCVGVATDLEPVHHLETLGEGLSFSVKVHVRKRSGEFVLKVFKHSLVVGENAAFDQNRFTALMMEAHVLGHEPLHGHENIVTMTEINMAIRSNTPLQISPALCLERAPHGTLNSFEQSVSKSQVSWAIRKMLCYDVAAGVKALHDCGIVHGDVKAENVLIFDHPARGYIAKISDFGSTVILPADKSQTQKIRLPAYTPPFNAPEATSYMVPSELPLTDVYSLGLLMWRILVHRDPFLLFDIPLDPELQLERKGTILALSNIAGLIPCFIEEDVGFLDAKEILLLVRIFAHTVSVDPKTRSLDRVLELLEQHSGRPKDDASTTPNSKSSPLATLPNKLRNIPSHLDWMQRFHYLVQRQILFALEDFCGFKPIPEDPQILPIIYEDMLLYEDAIWTVFNCYLLGIGTDPSPETALDVLYHSGLPENGRLWKSWIIIGPLYKALRIKLPEERTVHVAAMSINGKLGSEFHQIVLSGEEPYEHKVAKFHGIELSQEQFRQLGTRDADHSLDRNVSAHAELGDTEVGGGNTLLHASAFYDDAMMARHLIRNGLVDIDATNDLGETALLIACQYNSYDVLDLLLTNGVDASITDKGGQNGLCWLTSLPQQSTENIARRLVENGARLSWMVMDVHRSENTELFPQSFLQHGRVSGGPLLQAIARRDLHSVKILLQICIESYDKPIILPGALFAQPLRLAADLHLFEILEFLCRELFKVLTKIVGKEITPNMVGGLFLYITKTSSVLRGAVRMGQHVYRLCYHREEWKEAVRKTMGVLHQFGFVTQSMAVFNTMERTLNTAIGAGNYEIVKELLEHQKILDQIDDADEDHFDTPLNKALNSRRLDIVQLLVEKGATVDLRKKRDPKHKLSGVEASYLHVIASLRIENNDFAELLLEQGVPPDVKDNQGSDAFGLALCRCSFNLCRLLLSCGYNLRAPGLFGLTVLGQRFHEQLAKQHDDIYEAVKFLLEFDGPGEQSLFIVDATNNQSVLHIAVAYPLTDDTRYKDILSLLLSHFNRPEHLNAPAGTASKSTPLQMAIAMRNPIAAAALIEAGANINMQDSAGSNVMGIARHAITNFIGQDAAAKPKNAEWELKRAFQTLSVLANWQPWPEDFRRNQQVKAALEEVTPLLKRMMKLSHQECYLLGFETKAFQLVASRVTEPVSTLDALVYLSQEINSIIQPCLYAEIAAYVTPNEEWAAKTASSYTSVRRRVPWCKTINNTNLGSFQQAAALEWALQEVRERGDQKDGKSLFGLSRFAYSGDPAHLPIDHRFVRWPPTLLDWYVRVIQEDQVQLTASEKEEVAGYVKILRARRAAQSRGEAILPPFSPGFKKLHFEQLQPDKLDYDSIFLGPILFYRCRCFREKVSPWTVSLVELNSNAAKSSSALYGTDPIGALHKVKEREIELKSEEMKWKKRIGVDGEEGRVERTGARRRDSVARVLEILSEQMLRLLMSGSEPSEAVDDGRLVEADSDEDEDEDRDGPEVEDDPEDRQASTQTEKDVEPLLRPTGARNMGDDDNNLDGVEEEKDPENEGLHKRPTEETSSTPPPIEVEDDHVISALAAYIFHAHSAEVGSGLSRDTKFAIWHLRDAKIDESGRLAIGEEDIIDGSFGSEQEQIHAEAEGSVAFSGKLLEKRSTW